MSKNSIIALIYHCHNLLDLIYLSCLSAGQVDKLVRCPGLYCGRQILSNGSWSNCGACPRGYRTNGSSACIECNDRPEFYDWLYLGFMALIALVLHWFSIDTAAKRRRYFLNLSNIVGFICA